MRSVRRLLSLNESIEGVCHERILNNRSGARTPRMRGIASSKGISWLTSWRFPLVSDTDKGVSYRSTIGWYLLPGRARSTGEGPVWAPL